MGEWEWGRIGAHMDENLENLTSYLCCMDIHRSIDEISSGRNVSN